MGAPGMPPQGNGMAVASLVLGILAVPFGLVTWPGALLGILAIIFGALGISKGNKVGKGKGMAIAGLVLGVLGLLICVAMIMLVLSIASHGARHY